MEFRLLGPLEVAEHDRSLPLGGRKQRALLAVLLLHANEVVSVERLIDELWGESPPATVAKSVQVYVSRLRKQLGDGPPRDAAARATCCGSSPSELDVARFERAGRRGAGRASRGRSRPRSCARRSRCGAAPPLADLAYEPFAQAEIARLEELRARRRSSSGSTPSSRLGRHAELVGELEALVAEHPLRERLRGQLMLALYRSGPPGRGARGLPAARRRWSRSWGSSPAASCRSSSRRSCARTPSLDLAGAASGRRRRRRHAAARSSGRERELAALEAALDDAARRPRRRRAGRRRARDRQEPARRGADRAGPRAARRARARRPLLGGGRRAGLLAVGAGAARLRPRRATPRRCATRLGAGAAELAQLLPELRELVPDLPRAAGARRRGRALPALRGGERLPARAARGRAAGARARRPARRRRAVAAAAAVRGARDRRQRGCSSSCAFRDVDPTRARAAGRDARRARARAAHARGSRSPGSAEPTSADYIERATGHRARAALVAGDPRRDGGQPAVRRRGRAPARAPRARLGRAGRAPAASRRACAP